MNQNDNMDQPNYTHLDEILNQVEEFQNGPEDGQDVEWIGLNRLPYIKYLMQENFIPSEELLRLYGVYMSGKHDSWWCKASLTFREFLNTIKMIDTRESRYSKEYRRGFSDGIHLLLNAMVD